MVITNLNALALMHSYIRWVALFFIVLLMILSVNGWVSRTKRVSRKDTKIALWAIISGDIMLVIGVILWFFGDKGYSAIQEYGMKTVMESAPLRFHVIEHPLAMVVAIILLHIGKSKLSKDHTAKVEGTKAYKKLFIYTGLAFVIILASIPWPWREGIGRPLFHL